MIVVLLITINSSLVIVNQAYTEAEEVILRVTGRLHPIVDRLYLNMGIYFEEVGNANKAYDYFYMWYDVCTDLYGPTHPKTKRCISTLNEGQYKRIANERGKGIPLLPTN